jgi:outer membrane receptor protein involved in Fe transport
MTKNIFSQLMLCTFFLLFSITVFAQEISISGKITESDKKEALIGATVRVLNTNIGTNTDVNGQFSLKVNTVPPFKLSISMLGYETKEIEITGNTVDLMIELSEQAIMGKEVVVSASRVSEDILTSPITIEKMNIQAVRNSPSVNFYDALANQKGVDIVSSSMLIKSVNTRGFAGTFNPRFVTRIDGMDAQSPGFSIPLGNILGVSELDLESSEIIPSTASALYGPNAFNGILNITSRDPFLYQGLSAQVKTGIAQISENNSKPLYDLSLRYAKAFNNKFAFKVNASYIRAEDWHATDMTDINKSNTGLSGANNPARDAVNTYGDETSVADIASGKLVSRTGYTEEVLANYKTQNLKLDAWLHYKITEKIEISYMAKYATATGIIQGGNRFMLDGTSFVQNRLEIKGTNFYVRAFNTSQDLGDSYDTRALANGLEAASKDNISWYKDYADAFTGSISGYTGNSAAEARRYADRNRLIPGTATFEQAKSDLISKTSKTGGAKIYEKSSLSNVEGQWDLSNTVKFADVLVGGNIRYFSTESNGLLYNDDPAKPGSKATNYYEYGAFAQVSKKIFNDIIKISAALRYDKSQYFDGLATPRIALVISPKPNHHFRISYQTGFKSPILQEQFLNLDFGSFQVIGGAPGVINGNPAQTNSFALGSVNPFVGALLEDSRIKADPTILRDPVRLAAVAKDYYNKLQKSNISFVKPETVQTFEIGYKTLINNKLFFDLSYYYSNYDNFIGYGQVMNVTTPTSNPESGADILLGKSKVYIITTNALNSVYSTGISAATNYSFGKGFNIGANATWAKLYKRDNTDPIVPSFNTPEYKTNVTFGNRNLYKNIGFNLAWRWQDSFIYQFAFATGYDGVIPSFHTFDAQVSYRVMKNMAVKIGGANIFNQRYTQGVGTPTIGSLYYLSVTFDPTIR